MFASSQKPIEPICYADDSNIAIKLSNRNEADIFLSILLDVKLATGLEVNPSKSEIIVPSPSNISVEAHEALQLLGNIVEKTSHLGIEISSSHASSLKFTWENTIRKLERKISNFKSQIGYEDMLHKKLLCSATLHSSITHILRIFHPSIETVKTLDKELLKALWQKSFQGKVYGRTKIAKDRVTLPISKGGINWKTVESRSFTNLISSFFHTIKYILEEPASNLAQMFPINQQKFFCRGSSNMTYLLSLIGRIFPSVLTSDLKNIFTKLVRDLEKHKQYFHLAPPLYNSNFMPFPLTETDSCVPIRAAIGGILARPSLQKLAEHKPQDLPLKWNQSKIRAFSQNTQIKLQNSLLNIHRITKTFTREIVVTPPSHTCNFFYQAVYKNNAFFTKAFYKLLNEKAPQLPPAYTTRTREGAPVTQSPENFILAYKNLGKAKIPSHTKSFMLDILNRTAPSRRMLHISNILPNSTCPRCDVISDSFHTQFECTMGYMAFTAISKHFKENLPSLQLNEENFCFYVPIKNASQNMNDQFLHLFGSFSHLSFSIITHERFHIWSPTVFYAKLLSITELIIQIRRGSKLAYKELLSFRDSLTAYVDIIEFELVAPNKGHFRAFPPID
jgi:hypothetical protein